MIPKIAVIVLSYNTPEMTDELAEFIEARLDYGNFRLYVVDNGSERRAGRSTHSLQQNLGFTRGMHEGYKIALSQETYDAFWFLNSDISFDYGPQVLLNLTSVLFHDAKFAQISPQHGSPHPFMRNASSIAQEVPYLEPTATLIKASTIANIGFWDSRLSHGWGVDYDYGFRVRTAGLKNILTNTARIVHKEHRSIVDFEAYARNARHEMELVLAEKYGPHWRMICRLR